MNHLHIPTLETERLVLRPFAIADGRRVQQLAGDRRVAEMTSQIPHPYPDRMAEIWIASHPMLWRNRKLAPFAVILRDSGELIGAISLRLFAQGPRAEIGYWIGVPYWNHGYATEAGREVLRFGFEDLELESIQGRHLLNNPASGRVMEKLGMRCEGVLHHGAARQGRLLDVTDYSIPAGNFRPYLRVA
ncbi:GNAT family N-acetyltransferase [Luteolibacter ambystomatis]|uniref:GNAT family N-acetyltransferase n=1 Tax=Luteolibacter ambystomatis TaxID=2824561 RepID=A0A975IYD4_9BACT|nr:GNAT family N-acetyltransferase [Luteolibacter ambystomatis]QUE50024.1 GNAT family N-acetyltransferase [Luteolibacter ambystomatis]